MFYGGSGLQAASGMSPWQPPPSIARLCSEVLMKTCTKCNEKKPLSDFHKDSRTSDGKMSRCKKCKIAYMRQYNDANREKINNRQREYYFQEQVKERHAKWCSEYYQKNKSKIDARKKEWAIINIDRVRKGARRSQRISLLDGMNAEKHRMRSRLAMAVASKGFINKPKTEDMLGCDWEYFISHIESQFTEGMGWHNRSEWHIDHIVPLNSASSVEELAELAHYTNLQPLWAKDNLAKGAKIDYRAN